MGGTTPRAQAIRARVRESGDDRTRRPARRPLRAVRSHRARAALRAVGRLGHPAVVRFF